MESNIRVLFFLWYNKVWILRLLLHRDFRGSSVGKESACNAGDPGSGRSTGEGIGYPLQYYWASFVAQLVKNPPAMRDTRVWSLGWLGRSPGEGKGYPLQYSGLEKCKGVTKSPTQLNDFHFHFSTWPWDSLIAQYCSICLQYKRPGFDSWVEKISWRRK